MNKIRILRVISSGSARKSFKRKDDKKGRVICGPESKALELCSKLNRQKFETIMVYGKGGRLVKEFENIGVKIEKFVTISKFDLYEALYLYHMIKVNKIDIVQTHGLRFDFFGGIAAMLANVPHIITRHVAISQHLISNFRKKLYVFFDNIAIKFATKVVTVSKTVGNDLIVNQGIVRSKIVTILNGVDLERFCKDNSTRSAMREELGADDKKQIVGMIAQLSYWKGIPYFLKAIPAILRKCPNTRFLIVGDGPERENLEIMAKREGISSYVIFAGFRSRNDIPEIISAIDISVLSSLREGLPLALLESMAMSKPVVATDVGGVSEIVQDEKTGFLIPPRDSDALSDAIIKLLKDKEKANKFGRAGRKYVEQSFSLELMIKKYENLYTQIANKNF